MEKNQLSHHSLQAIQSIVSAINHRLIDKYPLVVCLDGGSGAGKSTLADEVASELNATVIHCDDFFDITVPDSEWDTCSLEQNAVAALTGNVCTMKHCCHCWKVKQPNITLIIPFHLTTARDRTW